MPTFTWRSARLSQACPSGSHAFRKPERRNQGLQTKVVPCGVAVREPEAKRHSGITVENSPSHQLSEWRGRSRYEPLTEVIGSRISNSAFLRHSSLACSTTFEHRKGHSLSNRRLLRSELLSKGW